MRNSCFLNLSIWGYLGAAVNRFTATNNTISIYKQIAIIKNEAWGGPGGAWGCLGRSGGRSWEPDRILN